MLSGAPPMLVVGLALHALFVPFSAILRLLDSQAAARMASMSFILFFVGLVMVVAGELELARRTRGRARAGMVIAMLGDACAFGILVFSTLASPRWMYEHELVQGLYTWGWPIAGQVALLGLVLAAGLRQLVAGILTLVVIAIVFPLPPVASFVYAHLRLGGDTVILFGSLMGARSLGLVWLAHAVGRTAAPVHRDHLRAARGLRWAAIASGVGAVAAIAMFGFRLADGDPMSKVAMVVYAAELIAIAAMAKSCWGIAQAQLETLSLYLVHVALAVALATIFAAIKVTKDYYDVAELGDDIDLHVPAWIQLGGILTTAWLIVVLGRYARRTNALVRVTVLCGGGFTALSCAGIALRGTSVLLPISGILANLVMVPLFVKAARQVADDPVKTTADVFA